MIQLDNVKPSTASAALMSASTLTSVFLMVFLLNRDLFNQLDLVRLLLSCAGIAVPIVVCNAMFAVAMNDDTSEEKENEAKEEREKLLWGVASALSIILISFVTLLGYTYQWSLYGALWTLFWVEMIIVFISIISRKSQGGKIHSQRKRN